MKQTSQNHMLLEKLSLLDAEEKLPIAWQLLERKFSGHSVHEEYPLVFFRDSEDSMTAAVPCGPQVLNSSDSSWAGHTYNLEAVQPYLRNMSDGDT